MGLCDFNLDDRDIVVISDSCSDSETELTDVRPVGSQRSWGSGLSCSQTSGGRTTLNLVASQQGRAVTRSTTSKSLQNARNRLCSLDQGGISRPPVSDARNKSKVASRDLCKKTRNKGKGRQLPVSAAVKLAPKQQCLSSASRSSNCDADALEQKATGMPGRPKQQQQQLNLTSLHSRLQKMEQNPTRAKDNSAPLALQTAPAPSLRWSQMYAPSNVEDMVVHKKKLMELRSWMETTIKNTGRPGPGCLLLTGPPGSGKTTAVQLMASELGITISEWNPPPCTTWSEHLHSNLSSDRNSAPAYRSKLDEFDEFIGRSALFPQLAFLRTSQAQATSDRQAKRDGQFCIASSTLAGGSSGQLKDMQRSGPMKSQNTTSKQILLVDDLPHAAGPEQRGRIAESLSRLAGSSRFPVIVITTTGDRGGGGGSGSNANSAFGHTHGLHKDLVAALEAAGVHVLSFNPITVRNAAKALKEVSAKMGIDLVSESAMQLAESAAGDLHNALESLQLCLLGHRRIRETASSVLPTMSKGKSQKRKRSVKVPLNTVSLEDTCGSAGMDAGLSVFHAIGKLLHNKRDTGLSDMPNGDFQQDGSMQLLSCMGNMLSGSEPKPAIPVAERLKRKSAKANAEKIIMQSQLSSDFITGYLQENILDFVGDARVEDAAACLDYLSLSDIIGSRRCRNYETPDTFAALSSSIAARGTMWANSNPLSRWQPLRMPVNLCVQRAAAHNQDQLSSVSRSASYAKQAFTGCREHLASEVLPYLRCLQHSTGHATLRGAMPRKWMHVYNGKAVLQEADKYNADTPALEDIDTFSPAVSGDDDRIEDC